MYNRAFIFGFFKILLQLYILILVQELHVWSLKCTTERHDLARRVRVITVMIYILLYILQSTFSSILNSVLCT